MTKKKQETKTEVVEAQPVNVPERKVSTVKLNELDYKKISIVLGVMLLLLAAFIAFIMFSNYDDKLTKYLGYVAMGCIMLTILLFRVVQKTIGWDFVRKVMYVSKNKAKGYVMLKVHTVSGRPKYEIAKGGKWVTYEFKESGNNISKRMFYDPLAIYNDYVADVPILEGTPDDIFPTNRFTGTRVTTSPELVEKTIIDSSKSADELDKYKKYTRYALIGLGIMAVGLFFGFDLYRQSIDSCNANALALLKESSKSATVVAGSVLFKRQLKW